MLDADGLAEGEEPETNILHVPPRTQANSHGLPQFCSRRGQTRSPPLFSSIFKDKDGRLMPSACQL